MYILKNNKDNTYQIIKQLQIVVEITNTSSYKINKNLKNSNIYEINNYTIINPSYINLNSGKGGYREGSFGVKEY